MNNFDIALKNVLEKYDKLAIITDYNYYTKDGEDLNGIMETPLYDLFTEIYDELYPILKSEIIGVSSLIDYTLEKIL